MSEQILETKAFTLPKRFVFVKPARNGIYSEILAKHGMTSINDASVTLTPAIDAKFKLVKTGLSGEEQSFLESKLGLKVGELDHYITNPFWQEYYIKLKYNTEMLNLESPSDYLKYKILVASEKCAQSVDEISPESLFYLEDIENTTEKLSSKADLKLEATELFAKFSAEDRKKLLKIYGENPTGNTDKFIKGMLFDKLESNPKQFIEIASKSKERIFLEAFIFDLISKGVLRERAGVYFDKDINKGSKSELVEKFLDPKYQEEYEAYRDRLEFSK